MMKKYINGYVIKPPVSAAAWWHMSYRTFGLTEYETWANHCHVHNSEMYYNHPDISKEIQAWHDRGYRLREATPTIHCEDGDMPAIFQPKPSGNDNSEEVKCA
jgi:hypothetical protein